MPQPDVPTRHQAIRVLERGRAETLELIDILPHRALTTAGLDGGEWSPKDLIGHLTSWEEYALDALAAWDRGERAPIDELQFSVSTSRINRQNVERKAAWTLAKVRRESARVHQELVGAIEGLAATRWGRPATARGRTALAVRLGNILGGPKGLYRHEEAHHPSLRAFAELHHAG
jgi:hypothetical protein